MDRASARGDRHRDGAAPQAARRAGRVDRDRDGAVSRPLDPGGGASPRSGAARGPVGWRRPRGRDQQRGGAGPRSAGRCTLADLFEQTAPHWAAASADAHRWRGLAVYGVDGSTLRIADTPENEPAFGRPAASRRGEAGYPQLRLVALMVLRSHLLAGLALGPCSTGESRLAESLFDQAPRSLAHDSRSRLPLLRVAPSPRHDGPRASLADPRQVEPALADAATPGSPRRTRRDRALSSDAPGPSRAAPRRSRCASCATSAKASSPKPC